MQGPVSPVLWERFKSFEYDSIKIKGPVNVKLDAVDKGLLEDVWETYGDSTENALAILTQRERPWREARQGYEPDETCTVVISSITMASYYKSIHAKE